MKKSLISLFVMLFLVFVCASCSCKKEGDKASLQVGDMNATTYKDITMNRVKEMIADKDSFVLYVYMPDCSSCQRFKPILEKVIQERHLNVYALQANRIESGHELSDLRYTPSIAIYDEGNAIFMTDPIKNEEYFVDDKGVISLLDKYTYMPTLYYISKEHLDEKIANDESFIVYFSRSSCADCSYLNRNYLKSYLKDRVKYKVFTIDQLEELLEVKIKYA